ncbi:MAG: carboxypeptidase-like regulatory domain-containing protein, partial [Gemmatimonadales bacterium]
MAVQLVAWASLLAAPARAQVVVVRVAAAPAERVPGVLLTLMDPDGSIVARALSNERGLGVLRPGRVGSFLLKVDRIGYLGHTVGPFTLADRETLPLTVAAPTERVALPELTVGGTGVEGCELTPAEAEVTELLWREAKKALTSSMLPTDSSFLLEVARYQRTYSAAGSVREERSQRDRTRAAVSPFVAADPAELAAKGYHQRRGSNHRFYAPDAGTVLSDEFVGSHCFRALPADSGLVGLAFKPARPVDRRTEVSGTLWLDHASLELRRIDFEYLNVEKDLASGREGGSMSFGRLPNGRWIVAAWHARVGYSEQGGEVSLVGPDPSAGAPGPIVTGTVFDSTRSMPISGAVVTIAGGYRATTGYDGSFTLRLPNTGVFEVSVAHPLLDRFDAPRAGTVAAVIRGQQVRFDVAVPSAGT